MATYFIDYDGGNDANDGLSFANRKKTLTNAASAAAAGDLFKIKASEAPSSIGSATWTNLSKTVTVPSGLTSNINMGATAWTGSVNVTATTSATRKEGSTSSSLAIAAGFVTGLVAFQASDNTNYSGFQQVSFWLRANAIVASGVFELRLCSDALGLVTVDTIPVPAIPSVNDWIVWTHNTGGALGASIGSIALYALSDPGTVTVLLDNIIACKSSASADALTLTSLISKNTATETWYGIQSINGTTVLLDNTPNTAANAGRGYAGTTETVTTYKREPHVTALNTTVQNVIAGSGTAASPIVVSGGWNTTDMSTQTDVTWLSGNNGDLTGLSMNGRSWIQISKFNLVRFGPGCTYSGNSNNMTLTDCAFNNNATSGVLISPNIDAFAFTFTNLVGNNNGSFGLDSGSSGSNYVGTNLIFNNNIQSGFELGNSLSRFNTITARNNTTSGLSLSDSYENYIYNLTTESNGAGITNNMGRTFLVNASIAEATEVTSSNPFSNCIVFSHNHDGTTGNHQIYSDGMLISSETGANRRTTAPSGALAWALKPTSANRSATYPVLLEGIKIAVIANQVVTVSVYVNRTNSAISAGLFIKGGQIAGVPSDLTSLDAGSAGTYNLVTQTFTPTEAGVIDVNLIAYGGTTHTAYFDDMSISQA